MTSSWDRVVREEIDVLSLPSKILVRAALPNSSSPQLAPDPSLLRISLPSPHVLRGQVDPLGRAYPGSYPTCRFRKKVIPSRSIPDSRLFRWPPLLPPPADACHVTPGTTDADATLPFMEADILRAMLTIKPERAISMEELHSTVSRNNPAFWQNE